MKEPQEEEIESKTEEEKEEETIDFIELLDNCYKIAQQINEIANL